MRRFVRGMLTVASSDLQSLDQAPLLSWHDSTSGPAHAPQWTSVCKSECSCPVLSCAHPHFGVAVNEEPKGVGHGPQKHVARDMAAKEALKALGVTK